MTISKNSSSRMLFLSACLGNLFEHYDMALFSFLSIFLAPLIFPDKDPMTALILTYAMLPLGILARPLGALVFGYIGDVYGRQQSLFLTLAGMSFVSFGIAFSPIYASAGVLSPLIFCLGRILQNFLASGETMGGAIFLLENSPEKHHDLLSGFYNASTIGGILLASSGIFLLSHYQMIESGWRSLYLFGCLTAFFGCMIRRQIPPSKVSLKFSQVLPQLMKIFWVHRKPLLFIAISSGLSYANYSIALVLMNGLIPFVSSLTKAQMMALNTSLLILDLCALPLFGWLASKMSREKMMLASSLSIAFCAIPLCMLLQEATLLCVVGVRICFVLFGVGFSAPFHAWAQQLISPMHRYTIISFGYALGSQALGAPAAALSLWCFKMTGITSSIGWYWAALAGLSSITIAVTLRSKITFGIVSDEYGNRQ
jgi:MHS family proline/betaine transporter-like MFS transporter